VNRASQAPSVPARGIAVPRVSAATASVPPAKRCSPARSTAERRRDAAMVRAHSEKRRPPVRRTAVSAVTVSATPPRAKAASPAKWIAASVRGAAMDSARPPKTPSTAPSIVAYSTAGRRLPRPCRRLRRPRRPMPTGGSNPIPNEQSNANEQRDASTSGVSSSCHAALAEGW
jgi:hypothetical protein